MTAAALTTLVLRMDAVANAVLAAGVLAFLAPLTDAAGLGGTWPLAALAILLLTNAALCWRATRERRPANGTLRGLAAIDVVFTVAVLWFTLTDPTGAAPWLRLALNGLAIVVAVVAVTKLVLATRLGADRASALQR